MLESQASGAQGAMGSLMEEAAATAPVPHAEGLSP
jgi:hypothetical protein